MILTPPMRHVVGSLLAIVGSRTAALAAPCDDPIPVWRDGVSIGTVCPEDAAGARLTILDLGDTWTPVVLAPGPDGVAPAYRPTYLALADERFTEAGADGVIAADDRHLDIYGILPTLRVVRSRLEDASRHACHAAVDDAALAASSETLTEQDGAEATRRVTTTKALRAELDRELSRRGVTDLDALAAAKPRLARSIERLRTAERRLASIRAAQSHLACDGFLRARDIDGRYTWRTSTAVEAFQRGAMILADGKIQADTRAALVEDSREHDFRTALRVLRERVVAATGLIEDGTAGAGPSTVLDRRLEPQVTVSARGHDPLPDAAPDLIAPATEAAARAFGWTDPASAGAFLASAPLGRVAIALPAPPEYHGATMDLDVEIDRGDIWYDLRPRARTPQRRAALVLYATSGGRRIALVRWPTTIGGWQDEITDGIEKKWKESPVGPRVWRDLYVAPTWLPPTSTPDRELVRHEGGERYALRREALGPSYRSAYGLAMLIHHRIDRRRGVDHFEDDGIRTHGTANVASLARGTSHGCHRLLPGQALRLAGFLLVHRAHLRLGEQPEWYRRIVRFHGPFRVEIDTRGYLVQLDPPVPVNVLPGRIQTRRKTPPR
jgi:hypothetical protein